MSRLFAYMGNDPDRVACALYGARSALVAASSDAAVLDSWGIGFYQGEVLLQRRPKAPTDPVDFYAVSRALRTDAIIGHARAGTVGKPKNENTHPFRFRSWLFAHHGSIPGFETVREPLLALVPDFLRRNIRGQTDSEHLFHLVLAFLHDAGKLDDRNITTASVREAIKEALFRLEDLVGRDTMRGAECALAMTNGQILVATRHGQPVRLMRVQSVTDCPVCRDPQPQAGRDVKRIDHEHLRSVVIVADAPQPSPANGWQEVPDRHFIAVSHELNVELAPIDPAP
jgi:predicted glutamine amidotransferase